MDESRVTEVEIQLAHQQDLLQQLNEALVAQQAAIDKLTGEVAHLKDVVAAILRSETEDLSPPPHY